MADNEHTSETRFLLELLLIIILLLPAVLNKKARERYREANKRVRQFVTEEKTTATLISLITITSITGWLLPEQAVEALVQYPSDLINLRLHTLITAGFLHANIGHLVANMLALFIFGRQAEQALGTKKYLVAYFSALIISGVISSAANLAIGSNTPGIGASGAIMGIVAVAMLLRPLKITYILLLPLPIAVVGWLYLLADITGALGPADGIGHFAHLGGFLSIAAFTYLLGKEDKQQMRKGALICVGTLIIMIAINRLLF